MKFGQDQKFEFEKSSKLFCQNFSVAIRKQCRQIKKSISQLPTLLYKLLLVELVPHQYKLERLSLPVTSTLV